MTLHAPIGAAGNARRAGVSDEAFLLRYIMKAKPIDVVLLFKILVLQQLNNLSDDRIEFQIRDRLSFMRFPGLQMESRVPDAKMVWLFRERLKEMKLIDVLFAQFHKQLAKLGLCCPRWAND